MSNGIHPDRVYMQRCIDAAATAAKEGNYPLAALVVRNRNILAESSSALIHSQDPSALASWAVSGGSSSTTTDAGGGATSNFRRRRLRANARLTWQLLSCPASA
jgi:hypothetical protein